MAKSLMLDEFGDVVIPMRFIEGIDEVIQLVTTKILKIFNEDVYALDTGVDYFGIMLNHAEPDEKRKMEIQEMINQVPEITSVDNIDIGVPDENGRVKIRIEGMKTIFETVDVSI